MDTPTSYLVKDQDLPPGLDYAWLRRTGLDFLEQLCGEYWTDYNEHDPGVTLLEALCYLLTEVGNRASLAIPTLLATGHHSPGLHFGPTQQQLRIPPPTTPADYERLVLAKLPKLVQRVVVTPLTGAGQAGLYHVRIRPCPPPLAGLALDADRLGAEVLHLLNQHRNLGEVFAEVEVLKLRPVAVGGHVALGAGQAPGPALTSLLLEFNHHLPQLATSPYPAASLVPFFQHPPTSAADGLLAGRVAHEAAIQFKQASRTAGVHTLRGLPLAQPPAARPAPDAGQPSLQGLSLHPLDNPDDPLADDEVALLDPAQTLAYLTVTQQGLLISVDYDEVLRAYHAQVRFAEAQAESLPIPVQLPLAGQPSAADCGSAQEILPPLYGVGQEGYPLYATAPQRAAIMQFKGFLLLFDQLLANTWAQLTNVAAYFSPARLPASYFYAPLYQVPYVAPLLPDSGGPATYILPDAAWHNTPAAVKQWQAYQHDPHNAYVRALQELAATSGPVASSRQDFLKHLLARSGYAALPLPTRPGASPGTTAKQTVRAYEHLLRHLEPATYYRAAARLPARGGHKPKRQAESGLEYLLYLLTGLEPLARKQRRHGLLAELEAELQAEQGIGPAQEPSRLVLRGQVADFAQVVTGLADELLRPAGTAAPAQPWHLELLDKAGAHPPRPRHLWRLAARLERFCLLDHEVLRPRPTANDPANDPDFYEQQATVLLPAYAPRFRSWGHHRAPHDARNRHLVDNFISQFAPAYLYVHVLWLDYPAMRRWETLYTPLALASGLLNPEGHDHHHFLPGAQHRAEEFLKHHLGQQPLPTA